MKSKIPWKLSICNWRSNKICKNYPSNVTNFSNYIFNLQNEEESAQEVLSTCGRPVSSFYGIKDSAFEFAKNEFHRHTLNWACFSKWIPFASIALGQPRQKVFQVDDLIEPLRLIMLEWTALRFVGMFSTRLTAIFTIYFSSSLWNKDESSQHHADLPSQRYFL